MVALRKLDAPIKTITGLWGPWGVAISETGQMVVAESRGHCIYNPNGEKAKSFGQKGSAPGEFNIPRGVAVNRAGNILVVDEDNHRIQKFTGGRKYVAMVGSLGIGSHVNLA